MDATLLKQVGLTEYEYGLVVERLGRAPNHLELGMLGALWSEHCGYKHTKPLLKMLPSTGPRVVVGPGEENAGVVTIGDGYVVALKIESHNHPSAVEPYQGAATGVGGILRDIFTMGARPVAILDSLRFGPLSLPRSRYLFNGVVSGIADYGNCVGVPTVGGEVFFDPAYSDNPLVNVMCVGLAKADRLLRARTGRPGDLLILVGAATGRDGIHGATFASATLGAETEALRPAVQVGDPFTEKLLLEACLELAESGLPVGLQDLGAAGITAAAVEAAARGGHGVEIDVDRVPRREAGMTPYEVMLSESQERMLVIARPEDAPKVGAIFEKWGLNYSTIGRVTGDGLVRVLAGNEVVGELPVRLLTEPPTYRLEGKPLPEWVERRRLDLSSLPDLRLFAAPWDTTGAPAVSDVLIRLLASPNIASKEYVFRQYDHQVLLNTVVGPGADAAVLRVKGTSKAVAVTTDGNGRLCFLNPYVGAMIAVAEAARNLVCVGAEPIAATDCLNFGNPERPEIYWQLEEAVRGMAEALRALEIPVVSGNASLYNETEGQAVLPTPIVGMVGLIDDLSHVCTPGFKAEGDLVALVGPPPDAVDPASALAGSEYLSLVHNQVRGEPDIDLDLERRVQLTVLEGIRRGIIRSAHDCSEGGLAVALAECCIHGGLGFRDWSFEPGGRLDAALFGETQSRIIVSVSPGQYGRLRELARNFGVPLTKLGIVGGQRFTIKGIVDLPLSVLAEAWRQGLVRALESAQ
jgi:phosphoribosylformylglycinamidine synthase II